MYLWRAWHEQRGRIALYGGACLALGLLLGVHASLTYRYFASLFHRGDVRGITTAGVTWGYTLNLMLMLLPPAMLWAALALGVSSIGGKFRAGTSEFLLTRPGPRGHMVWSEWALGMAALFALPWLMVMAALPFLFALEGRIVTQRAFVIPPIMLLMGAAVFGLAQVLTFLTRSAWKGLNYTIAAILIYQFLPEALATTWKWPGLQRAQQWMDALFENLWMFSPSLPKNFLWAQVAAWTALALAFPLLTHWLVRRRQP